MLAYTTIGSRLRAAREAAGKSQAQVARRLKMTPQNVSLIEKGTTHADLDVLEEFARAVGASIVFDLAPPGVRSTLLLSRLARVLDDLEAPVLDTLEALVDSWEEKQLRAASVG